MTMSTKHCLLPWIERHAAWAVNRYVIHSDGYTSVERRLGKKLRASNLRIWRDTTLPSTTTQETSKGRPTDAGKHLARKSFRNRRKLRRNGIRRTKGTNSTETTTGLQIRSRTVVNKVSGTPWAPRRNTYNPSFATLLDTQLQPPEKRRSTQDFGQQTNATDDIVAEPATKQQRATPPPRLPSTSTSSSRPLPDTPMATSPTGRQHPPLPAPPLRQALRRMTPEEVMQPTKARKTSKDTTIRSTEQATKEPQPLRQKINAVTLPNGTSIKRRHLRRSTHNLRQRRL